MCTFVQFYSLFYLNGINMHMFYRKHTHSFALLHLSHKHFHFIHTHSFLTALITDTRSAEADSRALGLHDNENSAANKEFKDLLSITLLISYLPVCCYSNKLLR